MIVYNTLSFNFQYDSSLRKRFPELTTKVRYIVFPKNGEPQHFDKSPSMTCYVCLPPLDLTGRPINQPDLVKMGLMAIYGKPINGKYQFATWYPAVWRQFP